MNRITFPRISQINAGESLLFFSTESTPVTCVFCSRDRVEPPIVRSGGARIDVFYLRVPSPGSEAGTLVCDSICWACVRGRAHGSKTSHEEWRAVAARFLNDLHASDPGSYYCGIRGLE